MSRMQSVPSDFQAEFKLMLKCEACCEKLPANQKQHSITQCRLIGRRHTCGQNMLIGIAVGSNQVFQIRPFPGISAKPVLCNSFGHEVCSHAAKKGTCTFAHSEVERAFWTAEQRNRKFREDVMNELRETIDPISRRGSVVNGETGSRPSTSMSSNSPKTKNPNQATNAAHIHTSPKQNQKQQQQKQQSTRVQDSKQDFINNLLRSNPGYLTYICLLCYNAENEVRERVDDNDWCMKKHQFPDCFMLALFNLAGTKLLKMIREPPDESLPGGSSQLCRAPLNPKTQRCTKNFCTSPHSEIEMEVWNFCIREKVSYFSLADTSRDNNRQPAPASSTYSPGSSTQGYTTQNQQQQQQQQSNPSQQVLGDYTAENRLPRPTSKNSAGFRNFSSASVANSDYTGKRLQDYFDHAMKRKTQLSNNVHMGGDNGRVPNGRMRATYTEYANRGMPVGPARRIRAWQQQQKTYNSPPMNPLLKRANIVSIYFCRYCNKHVRNETELETHKRTKRHMEMEKMDQGRAWKFPPPPTYCDAAKLKLCEVNEIGQCPSARANTTEQCLDAHGQEMLNEWKERVEFRRAKRDVERSLQNKKFLEKITKKYKDAQHKTEVVERNVDKLDIRGLQVRCPTPPYRTSAATNEPVVWPFSVSLPQDSEVSLKRVALWHDTHRSHFCIKMTQLERDSSISQIVNESDFQDHVTNNFTFYIHFQSRVVGTFKQSIVFDFCQLPYLEIELVVDVGLHDLSDQPHQDFKQVKEKAISDSTWNEKNIKVIRSKIRSKGDKRLLKKFPMKDLAAEVITADFMNMTNPLKWIYDKYEYKNILTRLMNIERFQCQEVLSTLNIQTNVTIRRNVGGDQMDGLPAIYPDEQRNVLLFGEVPLDSNISLDTERGRILFHYSYFEAIWLRPREIIDKNVVFECTVINLDDGWIKIDGRQKDRLFVVITREVAQMMSDYGLLPEDYNTETFENVVFEGAEVQFKLNEVEFSKLAQNLDAIDDQMLMHLFPKNDSGLVKQASHQVQPSNVGHFNQLDERQVKFIKMALVSPIERKGHPLPPLLLYGPFGMGKTFAIGNLIIQLLAANTNKKVNRILVCTWTNSAADIYIREYLSSLGEGFSEKILRLQSDFRKPNFYDAVVMDYCLFNEERTAFRIPAVEKLNQFDVVVSTVSACRYMVKKKSRIIPFTHIILDEAGQCLEVDSLIPFKIATNKTRLIMAGDPAQQELPVFSKIARRYKYNLSPLERMRLLYKQMGNGMLENNSIIFCNNYRCVQPILDFVSPHFYTGKTLIAKSTDFIPPEHYPLMFSHCQGNDMVRGDDISYTNLEECERIVDEVKDLMINWPINHWGTFQANQICVLAPYHEQVKLIRQRLKSNGIYGVDVQRVNNVQGREYRVVIISVVRTLEGCYDILAQLDGEEQFEDVDFAFLSDRKMLNSALSRTRNKIIVVGDAPTMIFLGKCQEVWQEYIIRCFQNQSVRPVNLHPASIEKNLQQRQEALQAW